MRMHKIRSRRIFVFWLKILIPSNYNPIKTYIFIVFFRKCIWYYFTIYWCIPKRVICVFQFVRVYVRINFLNALIILFQSTSRNVRELKIHDNIYPNYEKYDNICSCLYFRVYQFTYNSVNNSRIQVYIIVSCVI